MSPTGTELESRLTETLRAKADQVALDARPFEPDAVHLVDARRRPRTAWLVAAAAFIVVAIAIGVGAWVGGSDSSRPERTRPAVGAVDGEAVARLAITALPELRYDPAELTTVPGVNEIQLLDAGGTHTLVFADPALAGARLAVPNGANRVKVDLEPGRDYTFFCVIPGHRASGMEGVIHVLPDGGRSTAPVPTTLTGSEQTVTIAPLSAALDRVLRRFGSGVDPSTRRAVSVDGSPPFALYDGAQPNGSESAWVSYEQIENPAPFTGSAGVQGYSAPINAEGRAGVLLLPHWPAVGRQGYAWTRLPSATAFVSYELGAERFWQRPVWNTAAFVVTRPEQFDGPTYADWHSAAPPVLRAYDAEGRLLAEAKGPRIGNDDLIVSPNAPGE